VPEASASPQPITAPPVVVASIEIPGEMMISPKMRAVPWVEAAPVPIPAPPCDVFMTNVPTSIVM